MSLNILERINHGYGELEPVVIGLMAMNKSFMLIGRHGAGKSRLARVLSRGSGEGGYVFYDATKDDLISIAGIPDPESIKAGRLRFVAHQRTIWDKSTVVVDEITRANKESQNLWLEILEERTCFGLPLAYRTLVATANPESYAAAFQLDEALLDRFHAVIPVPELQEGIGPDDIEAMVRLAAVPDPGPEPAEIARVFAAVQAAHAELLAEGLLTARELPASERVRLEVAAPATFEQRVDYVRANWAPLVSALSPDEVEKVLGELLRGATKKGEQEKLVVLKHLLDELGYRGDALRQVDGRLLIALNSAVNHAMPRLARALSGPSSGARRDAAAASIEAFRALVAGGTFNALSTPEARRLKGWLIDLREGDVPDTDEAIIEFFAGLRLEPAATGA